MVADLMENRSRKFWIHLIGVLFLLILGTLAFWHTDWDRTFASAYWNTEQGWFASEEQPWNFLYYYGTAPGIVAGVAALVVFFLSFRFERFVRWRKVGGYFALVVIVGPGLISNAGFKENFGRPRPRQIEEFGGKDKHEEVWKYDATSDGKSFPCGHATMGFAFFGAFFLLRGARRHSWAWLVFAFAMAWGTLIGVTRAIQGGHFLSDALWSAGFCYLVALIFYHVMRMDEGVFYKPKGEIRFKKTHPAILLLGLVAVCSALFAVSMATPYHETKIFRSDPELVAKVDRAKVSLRLIATDIELVFEGDGLHITGTAEGFGVPGSAVKETWKEEIDDNGEYYAQLKQRESGLFAELMHNIQVIIPNDPINSYVRLQIPEKARLDLDLSKVKEGRRKIILDAPHGGRVSVALPAKAEVKIDGGPDGDPPSGFVREDGSIIRKGEGARVALEFESSPEELTVK